MHLHLAEIGSVGLTEQQAKEKNIPYRTGKYAFAALGKAMAMNETGGFVKWIARTDNDQLIGAHAIGPHATELISEATVAIRAELTAEELGRTIHCHPTLSETWMEAAHAVHGTCIHAHRSGRGDWLCGYRRHHLSNDFELIVHLTLQQSG